jgi:hypothetical protein
MPAPPPQQDVRPPPNIDELLRDIKTSVTPAAPASTNGRKGRGSTGKSVKISL